MATRLHPSTGFTLAELLVTVALVGLLATLAYPSYRSSVRKAHRSDGIAAALALQLAQERLRASCPYYAQSLGDTNSCGAGASESVVQAASTSPGGYYSLSIATNSASSNSYTIAAQPIGTQADDSECAPLTITFDAANPNGEKGPSICW